MFDLVFESATVVDGNGGAPQVIDVAIRDGLIVEVGRSRRARARDHRRRRRLADAGLRRHPHPLRRPGDLGRDLLAQHPPWRDDAGDGQLRCRLRAAACRRAGPDRLMEGVEDIPGVALAEGIDWRWESFPQYMDALDAMPHSLDFLAGAARPAAHVRDGRARRGAAGRDARRHRAMRALLAEALDAGAIGFSTGRTDNHRTSPGQETPASEADAAELTGLVAAFEGLDHGVVQLVSDFDLLRVAGALRPRVRPRRTLARGQRPAAVDDLAAARPRRRAVQAIARRVEAAVARGLPLYLQTAARGIGVITGLDASFHPFMGFPGYKEVADAAAGRARRGAARPGAHRRASWPRSRSAWPATARRCRRWWTSCWRTST